MTTEENPLIKLNVRARGLARIRAARVWGTSGVSPQAQQQIDYLADMDASNTILKAQVAALTNAMAQFLEEDTATWLQDVIKELSAEIDAQAAALGVVAWAGDRPMLGDGK